MSRLIIEANMTEPDELYAGLIDVHLELTEQQSHELNAALVLLLGNHIGDSEVLREALQRARAVVLEGAVPSS